MQSIADILERETGARVEPSRWNLQHIARFARLHLDRGSASPRESGMVLSVGSTLS